MKNLIKNLVAALSLTILACLPARATLVLDLTGGGSAQPCGTCGASGETFGWSFRVNNTITIDGLGVWDNSSNGIGPSTQVGIWTSSGSLLGSTTVSNTSSVVASASNQGSWLMESISALTLTPGDYLLGALFFTNSPLSQIGSTFTNIADITVGGGVRQGNSNTGFAAPLASFSQRIFGPTMHLQDANQVPEPTGLALVSLGLLCVAARRRRST